MILFSQPMSRCEYEYIAVTLNCNLEPSVKLDETPIANSAWSHLIFSESLLLFVVKLFLMVYMYVINIDSAMFSMVKSGSTNTFTCNWYPHKQLIALVMLIIGSVFWFSMSHLAAKRESCALDSSSASEFRQPGMFSFIYSFIIILLFPNWLLFIFSD